MTFQNTPLILCADSFAEILFDHVREARYLIIERTKRNKEGEALAQCSWVTLRTLRLRNAAGRFREDVKLEKRSVKVESGCGKGPQGLKGQQGPALVPLVLLTVRLARRKISAVRLVAHPTERIVALDDRKALS